MADEIIVQSNMTIRKDGGPVHGPTQPSSFRADMDGTKGPTPGMIVAALAGTDVDLSLLDYPGMCRLHNYDEDNFVQVGIREPGTSTFYPLLELGPGESYVIKLSRYLRQEYVGVGTATSAGTNFLHVKADTAPCNVLVEAFER